MAEFDCPSYNADVQVENGSPAAAEELRRSLEENDAFVIVSPEYNASMPGVLKNAFDWASRIRPQPFHARHCLLMSASPSMVGGNRGLWSLRVPFEHLGARVYPGHVLARAGAPVIRWGGRIAGAELRERFDATIVRFLALVEAATHYPCIKTAWVEFLGEHPDLALDRVR